VCINSFGVSFSAISHFRSRPLPCKLLHLGYLPHVRDGRLLDEHAVAFEALVAHGTISAVLSSDSDEPDWLKECLWGKYYS